MTNSRRTRAEYPELGGPTMSNPSDDLTKRAQRYANARHLVLEDTLGYGKDGLVFRTNRGSALKVFGTDSPYKSERNCYFRLAELQVEEILGHNLPQMLAWSDQLLVIEMTTVTPPYLLDFASARLDWTTEFPPEVLEQWEQDRQEEFGPRWPHVRMIMEFMRDQYGIYLMDVHPRNITFLDL